MGRKALTVNKKWASQGSEEREECMQHPLEDICACELAGEAWEAARKQKQHEGLGFKGVACASSPQTPSALKRMCTPERPRWRKLDEENSGKTESSKSESAKGQA